MRPILWYISALAGSMSSACLYIAMISAVGARCISRSDARNKAEVAAGNKQHLRQYLYFCTKKKKGFLKAEARNKAVMTARYLRQYLYFCTKKLR